MRISDWRSEVCSSDLPQSPANHSAIGYNAYSDPARRAAMVRAFDAGTPRATAPTVLRQEGWETEPTGFLVYAPVHDATASERREAPSRSSFKGFIFGVFKAEDLKIGRASCRERVWQYV